MPNSDNNGGIHLVTNDNKHYFEKSDIKKEFEELYYSTLTVSGEEQLEFLWDFLEGTVNDQY